jgi:hypothetical protein
MFLGIATFLFAAMAAIVIVMVILQQRGWFK